VTVSYATPAGVHEAVENLEADLGLTIHPQHWPGLVLDITCREPLAFICHPQHPLAARPAVTLRELPGQKFIGLRDTPHPAHLEKLPSHLRHLFEPLVECHDVEMVVRMVEIGDGVALLPLVTVRDKVAQGALAAVPLAVPLSRFTPRVGGGSAFYVRPLRAMETQKDSNALPCSRRRC